MSLRYASLNSGSNGNCYYVENEEDAIFVDAGLICKETLRRMHALGLSMQKVKAIFISHEHSDHVRGLDVISRNYQIPVYINTGTRKNHTMPLREDLVCYINNTDTITIGSLQVHPFSKKHDAADPLSFRITYKDHSVGVFTDMGIVCDNLIHHFQQCHAAILESNYDEEMLEKGPYPIYLKKRIRSDEGHLSNNQALELFLKHKPAFMKRLLLGHLSQQNNHPKIVEQLFQQHAGDVDVLVATRYGATKLYSTDEDLNIKKTAPENPMQLNMFDSQ